MANISEITGFSFQTPDTCNQMGCRYDIAYSPVEMRECLSHTHGRTLMTINRDFDPKSISFSNARYEVILALAAYAHKDDLRMGFGPEAQSISDRMRREIQRDGPERRRMEEYMREQAQLFRSGSSMMPRFSPFVDFQDEYLKINRNQEPWRYLPEQEDTGTEIVDRISDENLAKMMLDDEEDD